MYKCDKNKSYALLLLEGLIPCIFSWMIAADANAGAVLPSAGSAIQEVSQVPAARRLTVPELRIEQTNAADAGEVGAQLQIPVSFLQLAGNTVLSDSALLAASGFKPGLLTLKQLRGLAAAVAAEYHRNGYVLAQVMVPEQEIDAHGGPVKLLVLEGKFGAIRLNNASTLANDVVWNLLEGGARTGQVVSAQPLERSLLLMSDVPGVQVQSTLMPGAALGTSDLEVDVRPARLFSGSVDMDNEGNPYTGSNRVGTTLNVNNLMGRGDLLNVRAFGSVDGLLEYARIDYRQPVQQSQLGLALTHMTYGLGGIYSDLAATGVGDIATVYWTHALLRTRKNNVMLQWALDDKHFNDQQSAAGTSSDKEVQVLSLALSGDWQDDAGLGASSGFSLTGMAGNLNLRSATAQAADYSTAQTDGAYYKLAYSFSRMQKLSDSLGVYVGANGQLASKNLDISEKMELGGANGVRAYPEGEAYGDLGVVTSVELRWNLPRSEFYAMDPQFIAFVDVGQVVYNKSSWTDDPNVRNLGAVGLGLNLIAERDFQLKFSVACKLGASVATSSPDASSRAWLQFVKYL